MSNNTPTTEQVRDDVMWSGGGDWYLDPDPDPGPREIARAEAFDTWLTSERARVAATTAEAIIMAIRYEDRNMALVQGESPRSPAAPGEAHYRGVRRGLQEAAYIAEELASRLHATEREQ